MVDLDRLHFPDSNIITTGEYSELRRNTLAESPNFLGLELLIGSIEELDAAFLSISLFTSSSASEDRTISYYMTVNSNMT